MNLLSDLSSELAVAILVDKQYSEKLAAKDAPDLIGKICEILEPISIEVENKQTYAQLKEAKATSH